jgi:hypothetical protein
LRRTFRGFSPAIKKIQAGLNGSLRRECELNADLSLGVPIRYPCGGKADLVVFDPLQRCKPKSWL